MPYVISCDCGKRFQAGDSLAGKTVRCPYCSRSLHVPAVLAESDSPEMEKLNVSCRHCGARYAAIVAAAGRTFSCQRCGQTIEVQVPRSSPEPEAEEYALQEPPTRSVRDALHGSSTDYPLAADGRGARMVPSPKLRATAAKPPSSDFEDELEARKDRLHHVGGTVFGIAILVCALETVPGWGMFNFGWPASTFYTIMAVAGLVSGCIAGGRYCVPGMIGGMISGVGALFLSSWPLHHTDSIPGMLLLLLIMIGMLPGLAVFGVLRWLQDLILGKPDSR